MDLLDVTDKQQRKRHGFYPYDERYLEALPNDERTEAFGLVKTFMNCRYHGRKVKEGKLNRLTDLNAKGAIIRNTDGPSWMGGGDDE